MILATFREIVWKLLHKEVNQKVIPPFLGIRGVPPLLEKTRFFLKKSSFIVKRNFCSIFVIHKVFRLDFSDFNFWLTFNWNRRIIYFIIGNTYFGDL